LKIHPLGRVPAIQDGPLTMFESGAILEYLVEKYGKGRLTPAPGTPERGTFLQWVHFAEATALPPLSDMAQHTIFKPESERIPAVVADAHAKVTAILGVLEAARAGKQYLLGNEFSAADIMVGYALALTKWFGILSADYPTLLAYIGRLEQRPAFQKAVG
jgi:glutathione S-transferase